MKTKFVKLKPQSVDSTTATESAASTILSTLVASAESHSIPSAKVTANVVAESVEPFRSMKEAAALLNLQYWKIQRAVKDGLIPHYTLLNDKKLVKVSDILAAVKASSISKDADA